MKQIVLDFRLEKNIINKQYKTGILSFLKNCLSQSDEQFFNTMYDKSVPCEKNFFFSVYLKGIQYTPNGITLSANFMRVIFSTADLMLLARYYNAFLNQRNKDYPHKSFVSLENVGTRKRNWQENRSVKSMDRN